MLKIKKNSNLITSESVGKGHPDKICDQIADSILDELLKVDNQVRSAIEVMIAHNSIIIAGELNTTKYVDIEKITWKVLKTIGYHENDFSITQNIKNQSLDINKKVDQKNGNIGAGDQGIVFGYATNETSSYMPLTIVLAHEIAKRAETLRSKGVFKFAKADLKTQVTIDYNDQKKPVVKKIIFSIHHDANYDKVVFFKFIQEEIINYVIKKHKLNDNFQTFINPGGPFIVGGPTADTGLTGRKIIVDTYGGIAHHGGGSFSGKDYTKIDRSGAYFARWIAKNIVAAGLANKCEIEIAFGIGMIEPIAININTFNTEKIAKDKILNIVYKTFNFSLKNIIKELNLKKPIYAQTAVFGHFGNDDLPWEKLNKVQQIKSYLKK